MVLLIPSTGTRLLSKPPSHGLTAGIDSCLTSRFGGRWSEGWPVCPALTGRYPVSPGSSTTDARSLTAPSRPSGWVQQAVSSQYGGGWGGRASVCPSFSPRLLDSQRPSCLLSPYPVLGWPPTQTGLSLPSSTSSSPPFYRFLVFGIMRID